MIVLPYRTRSCDGQEFRPAHEYTIMFKLAGGDYYHVPATQAQQICPSLQTTINQAVEDGTAMTDVFEVPRLLEQDWKDWWTIHDYIVQGKSHTSHPQKKNTPERLERGAGRFEGEGSQASGARHTNKQASKQDITKDHPLTGHPTTTGCELTTYEPISSFLTDARVYILATHHGLQAGAEAAAAATRDRAAEILDCITDTESLFDTREALSHLESLVAAARLACEWEGPAAAGGAHTTAGLHAAVAAACATLGPLLAELPALWDAVAADGRFAELWEGLEEGRRAAGGISPEVRERMRWVVESRGA
ncbi:hypothetical protein INS49_008017 [Diaporthe citri]|uniref:uncharacterized protein n=1 Tax=Diaporthe citri TaxID=83186 RepID=UPI001C81C110|nr:uncharacterized protein INS49_008017 [Diaporthe citri]KAG6362922.1 hypothetical protein INS49_008017 [Diaporthe citri]